MKIDQAINKYNDEAIGYEIAFLDQKTNLIIVYDIDDDFCGKMSLEEFIKWNIWENGYD